MPITSAAAAMTSQAAPLTTPVLQSQSTALITPLRRRGIFRPTRGEQQLEAQLLSLAQAEELLHESESGSVITFVHSEPCQQGSRAQSSGSAGSGASGNKRHQLYISFKYRRTLIHYEYYWVYLKAVAREPRRAIFHSEQKHFDIIVELFNSFVPMLRAWLSAIVKAANFVDQPVESVDLRTLLRVRHHLVLTRRTALTVSVVLCKLDQESKKIVSTGIVFDFKSRRIRDDSGQPLRSFHEVFQQFLGLHVGYQLLPSPREEDEEEPQMLLGLLERLEAEAEAPPEQRMRTLLRLQQWVRGERAQRGGGGSVKKDNFERLAATLLNQLIQTSASTSTPRTPSVGTLGMGPGVALGPGDGGFSLGDLQFDGLPSTEVQVLMCDILAELCEMHVEIVGPHVWQICRGNLEDPAYWHACLVALGLLTLLSPHLTEWLLYCTDAATRLFGVLIEAHQQLNCQREISLRGGTPLRVGQAGPGGPTSAGRALGRVSEWSTSTCGDQPRRTTSSGSVTSTSSHHDLPGSVEQTSEPVPLQPGSTQRRTDATLSQRRVRAPSGRDQQQHSGPWPGSAPVQPLCRVPSFDDFDDRLSAREDTARKDSSNVSARSGDESATSSRPRLPTADAVSDDQPMMTAAAAAASASRQNDPRRPVRVPPLNLDLASRLPGQQSAGAVSLTAESVGSGAGAGSTPSMTRSSRRLRQKQVREPLPPQAPAPSAGSSSSSRSGGLLASVAHSLSAPVLGFKSCFVSPPNSATATTAVQPQVGPVVRQQQRGSLPGASERQCQQQADQLCVALGESALLADLSLLLRWKQEQQVHDAVLDSMRPGMVSPAKPSSCSTTPRGGSATAAAVRPPPNSPPFLTSSPKESSAAASSLRLAARQSSAPSTTVTPPVPGGLLGVGGGSHSSTPMAFSGPGMASYAASPRYAERMSRMAFRRVRLQACLVLERFCACSRQPADLLGPHVPVNRLFEMLNGSCSARSGACSFALDDDDHSEGNPSSPSVDANGEPRNIRGLFRIHLCPERLQRIGRLQERLHRSSSSRRCVCGALGPRAGGIGGDDPCACVDDALAACLWRLLGMHVRHVEELHRGRACQALRRDGHASSNEEEASLARDQRLGLAWHARLHLDPFLSRIAGHLRQALLQPRQASNAAGGADTGLQHKGAFLLRLCCCYLRHCPGKVLPLQAWQVVGPVLAALKPQLVLDAAVLCGALPQSVVRLWVAYLELVGLLLRGGVFSGGAHCPAFGEVVLVQLLDFPPVSQFPSAPAPQAAPTSSPVVRTRTLGHSASGMVRAPPDLPSDAQRYGRCRSQRSLHPPPPSLQGSASVPSEAPPRPPAPVPMSVPMPPASPLSEARGLAVDRPGAMPTSSGSCQAPPGQAATSKTGELPRSMWALLPKVLERIFFSEDELTAGRSKQHLGEDSDGVRCRVLIFVEALLEFGHAALTAARPSSAGVAAAEAAAEAEAPRTGGSSCRQLLQPPAPGTATGVVGSHDQLQATMTATAESLVASLLDGLRFLFLPPGGLLCKLARKLPLAGPPLVLRLVQCERALFRVPAVTESVYCHEASISEYYVRRHFLAFVRLYNSRRVEGVADAHFVRLCCLHLQTLLAIASLQTEVDLPRRAFSQLSVLDFLAGEIDLEHETTQMRDRFLRVQRQASSRYPLPTLANLASSQPPPATASPQQPAPLPAQPAVVPTLAPSPAQPPCRMRTVPRLQLRGLRPSLQGCSGLGAPPPEEPVPGDGTTDEGQSVGGNHSVGEALVAAGVPKLSFAGLPGAALAPVVDEPGDSGTGSTLASSGARGSLDEQVGLQEGEERAPRRAPPVIPRLAMQGISQDPCQEGTAGTGGSPTTSRSSPCNAATWSPGPTPITTPFSSACGSARRSNAGNGMNSDRRRLVGLSPGTTLSDAAVGASVTAAQRQQTIPKRPSLQPQQQQLQSPPQAAAPQEEEEEEETQQELAGSAPPSSSSEASTPRSKDEILATLPRMTTVPRPVPQLSFGGIRQSLQGCSGLGAPPPEEPCFVPSSAPGTVGALQLQRPPIGPPPGQVGAPWQQPLDAREATQTGVLSPPPPSNSGSGDTSEGEQPVPLTQDPATGTEEPPTTAAAEEEFATEARSVGALQAASIHADDSSSDEEDDLPGQPALHTDVRPLPGLLGTGHPLLQPSPQRPAMGLQLPHAVQQSPGPVGGGMASGAPMPRLGGGVMRRQTASMPKLALNLKGLRPSLQGCSGLGAPPPEEPTPAEQAQAQPMPVQPVQAPMPLAEPLPGPPSEPAVLATPPGSGWHSPVAGPGQPGDLSCAGLVHQNVFYFEGRHRRRIYEDTELHALILTLILALLLTPRRGLLDPRYCDQYPLLNHKRNVPFLLCLHLNHSANRAVLPWVFQQVETIERIGGFRLLKLLCESAMHRWMYTNWTRVASGQFGTVYKCTAQLSETGMVAVKQIPKQVNIQDRCVFFDVFSEIACLDSIRFDDHVCHLYDYGVDESGYWIVMKYYSTTLKKWRESLHGPINRHVSSFLAVYRQILRAVHTLHQHGIVHYDLKCENIMIELERDQTPTLPEDPRVALGDFGESRIMAPDELDLRNRGTEIVKCPEMLELEKLGRKEGNSYDRRKRIGTNQAADIWSLGCLLFELVTGRFLFQNDDFGVFWARVTGRMAGSEDGDVVSEANCQLLEGFTPLLEFIRYMLVRDPQRRPTIAAAVQRFEAVAIETLRQHRGEFQSEDEEETGAFEDPKTPSSCSLHHRDSLESLADSPRSAACSVDGSSDGRSRATHSHPERPLVCAAAGDAECYFTKVLADLCILEASEEDLLSAGLGVGSSAPSASSAGAGGPGTGGGAWGALRARLARCAWTHVVDFRAPGSVRLPSQLDVPYALALPWSSPTRKADEFLRFLPAIFDFLRHAAISRGVVLFVDGYCKEVGGEVAGRGGGGLAVAAVLALVAETYRMAVYDALSLLSSQLLVAALRPDAATALARWQEHERRTAWAQCEGTVRLACLCGACSWHVPAAWLAQSSARPALSSSARLVSCCCPPGAATSSCPNRGGCESYTRWLQARFGVTLPSVRWLWLPEGVCAAECSNGPSNGALTQGLASQAEHVGRRPRAEGTARIQRFRCRSCQVLTHIEVQAPGAGLSRQGARVALLCSHELLRLEKDLLLRGTLKTAGSSSAVNRPPEWLHSASLEEVVLPRAQPGIEELL